MFSVGSGDCHYFEVQKDRAKPGSQILAITPDPPFNHGIDECSEACADDPACLAIVIDAASLICSLKNSISGEKDVAGKIFLKKLARSCDVQACPAIYLEFGTDTFYADYNLKGGNPDEHYCGIQERMIKNYEFLFAILFVTCIIFRR